MKFLKVVPTVFCAALLSAAFMPSAKADEWNKKTTVTFSGPVEIPGVHLKGWGILPAGTYVFKLLDSRSDRHIVQIFNADESVLYATVLAIPDYRLQPTDKTVITFNEGIEGRPEAIRAWFYPGSLSGDEFVYPKARAMEVAAATKTPVLFTPQEMPAEAATPIQADAPAVAQLQQAPVMAAKPTGEVVEVAEVTGPPPAQSPVAEPTPVQAPVESLPETASSLPLIALCGMLSLGGALAVRSMKNRVI
jgi:hypothetical protein